MVDVASIDDGWSSVPEASNILDLELDVAKLHLVCYATSNMVLVNSYVGCVGAILAYLLCSLDMVVGNENVIDVSMVSFSS